MNICALKYCENNHTITKGRRAVIADCTLRPFNIIFYEVFYAFSPVDPPR